MADGSTANGSAEAAIVPPIAAVFLVTFDKRKGYNIAWSRSQGGGSDALKLEGSVEFKSLPSGLHNVEEDLVYFVHGEHLGVSAFLRTDGDVAARNALMLSVGVLVPGANTRTGKTWLHAEALKELARKISADFSDYQPLEQYWEEHKIQTSQTSSDGEDEGLQGYTKSRAVSTTSLSVPSRTLTPHHPVLALSDLLDTFGPLIFPLFRATLSRKRVLILGEAPVELTCNFVYNISILASISEHTIYHTLDEDTGSYVPLRFFNVGISDIDFLSSHKQHTSGWIACTTDDVLSTKPQLFDLLVILPTSTALQKTTNKTYPKLIPSSPDLTRSFPQHGIRATQRDLRRYQSLKSFLSTLPKSPRTDAAHSPNPNYEPDSDAASEKSSTSTIADHREAVEPLSWPLIAYTSLVWWASAGDRRTGLSEAEEHENDQDSALLRESAEMEDATKEVVTVAYFHNLTALIFEGLARAVRRSSGDSQQYRDDEGTNGQDEDENDARPLLQSEQAGDGNESPVEVTEEDLREMGLDVWSDTDRTFVEEILQVWWRREAVVRGGTVECCGLRIV